MDALASTWPAREGNFHYPMLNTKVSVMKPSNIASLQSEHCNYHFNLHFLTSC